jgi:CRISPR/Cas system-associated exonuclease Cas4 (RecB family)
MKFRIRQNPAAQRVFLDQARGYLQRPREGIHVSDLVLPKKAFCHRKYGDIGISDDEVGYFLGGRGHHDVLEFLATLPEYREVRVELEGIRGTIDIYRDVPVEIKTTRSPEIKPPYKLAYENTEYLRQLGYYCSMVGKPQGQLWLFYLGAKEWDEVLRRPRTVPRILIYDVEYEDLGGIREEMIERKNLLLRALETGDPSGLPPCPSWMCRRCKYRSFCSPPLEVV